MAFVYRSTFLVYLTMLAPTWSTSLSRLQNNRTRELLQRRTTWVPYLTNPEDRKLFTFFTLATKKGREATLPSFKHESPISLQGTITNFHHNGHREHLQPRQHCWSLASAMWPTTWMTSKHVGAIFNTWVASQNQCICSRSKSTSYHTRVVWTVNVVICLAQATTWEAIG